MSQESKTQFLAFLLALLAGWPRFQLVIGLIDLTISLAIGGTKLMGREVAVALSGYSL